MSSVRCASRHAVNVRGFAGARELVPARPITSPCRTAIRPPPAAPLPGARATATKGFLLRGCIREVRDRLQSPTGATGRGEHRHLRVRPARGAATRIHSYILVCVYGYAVRRRSAARTCRFHARGGCCPTPRRSGVLQGLVRRVLDARPELVDVDLDISPSGSQERHAVRQHATPACTHLAATAAREVAGKA